MAEYTPDPRGYELMVLLSPELGDESLESEMERISGQLTGTGAEVVNMKATTPWGRRRLAYPIQNHTDAYYVLYSVSSKPGDLDPFERELKLNSNVLRYLLIRQEKAELDADETEEAAEAEDGAETDEAEAAAEASGEESQEVAEAAPEPAADETPEASDETDDTPAEGTEEEQT